MDEQQITVDGQRIAYTQSAGQDRPVIFVHGNYSSSRTWAGVLDSPPGDPRGLHHHPRAVPRRRLMPA